jgi:hypothetical protein
LLIFPNAQITEKEMLERSPEDIKGILHHGSPHPPTGTYTILKDGSNYINHKEDANLKITFNEDPSEEKTYAIKDI